GDGHAGGEFLPHGVFAGDLFLGGGDDLGGDFLRDDDDAVVIAQNVVTLFRRHPVDNDGFPDGGDVDASLAVRRRGADAKDGEVQLAQGPEVAGAAGHDDAADSLGQTG